MCEMYSVFTTCVKLVYTVLATGAVYGLGRRTITTYSHAISGPKTRVVNIEQFTLWRWGGGPGGESRGGGGGGGGGAGAVDLRGTRGPGRPLVPAGQPCPYLVDFWTDYIIKGVHQKSIFIARTLYQNLLPQFVKPSQIANWI